MEPQSLPLREIVTMVAAFAPPMLFSLGWLVRRWFRQKDRISDAEAEQTRKNREQAQDLIDRLQSSQRELMELRGQLALERKLLEWCEQDRHLLRKRVYGDQDGMRTGDGA